MKKFLKSATQFFQTRPRQIFTRQKTSKIAKFGGKVAQLAALALSILATSYLPLRFVRFGQETVSILALCILERQPSFVTSLTHFLYSF